MLRNHVKLCCCIDNLLLQPLTWHAHRDATGVTSEEEGMQRLEANLPRQTVINGARAMREFTNLFKAHMDKFREQGGDVVTKEVVDEFVLSLKQSRAP